MRKCSAYLVILLLVIISIIPFILIISIDLSKAFRLYIIFGSVLYFDYSFLSIFIYWPLNFLFRIITQNSMNSKLHFRGKAVNAAAIIIDSPTTTTTTTTIHKNIITTVIIAITTTIILLMASIINNSFLLVTD